MAESKVVDLKDKFMNWLDTTADKEILKEYNEKNRKSEKEEKKEIEKLEKIIKDKKSNVNDRTKAQERLKHIMSYKSNAKEDRMNALLADAYLTADDRANGVKLADRKELFLFLNNLGFIDFSKEELKDFTSNLFSNKKGHKVINEDGYALVAHVLQVTPEALLTLQPEVIFGDEEHTKLISNAFANGCAEKINSNENFVDVRTGRLVEKDEFLKVATAYYTLAEKDYCGSISQKIEKRTGEIGNFYKNIEKMKKTVEDRQGLNEELPRI